MHFVKCLISFISFGDYTIYRMYKTYKNKNIYFPIEGQQGTYNV
jgi:hypothetical protein